MASLPKIPLPAKKEGKSPTKKGKANKTEPAAEIDRKGANDGLSEAELKTAMFTGETAKKMKNKRAEDDDDDDDDPGAVSKSPAYQAFSRVDVDGSGRVSVREMARYLSGDVLGTYEVTFPVSDIGCFWNNDQDMNICIKEIEEGSPASMHPDVVKGLKLLRINGQDIEQKKNNIAKLKKFLKTLDDGIPVITTFEEPAFVVNPYNCCLDISMDETIYVIRMADGAYPSVEQFLRRLKHETNRTDDALHCLEYEYNSKKQRVIMRSKEKPFKLLVKSGKNSKTSMWSILGFFMEEDTEEKQEHTGKSRSMDLKLNITGDQVKILATELMNLYDQNENLLFEYDEFLQFFDTYLAREDKRQKLRDYCYKRFMTQETKDKLRDERRARRRMEKRIQRMEDHRGRNKDILKEQKEKRMRGVVKDDDGQLRYQPLKKRERIEAMAQALELQSQAALAAAGRKAKLDIFGQASKLGNVSKREAARKAASKWKLKLNRTSDSTPPGSARSTPRSARETPRSARSTPRTARSDGSEDTPPGSARQEERDYNKERKRQQMSKKRQEAAQKVLAEKEAIKQQRQTREWEQKQQFKQMSLLGLEAHIEQKNTGAEVAHPAWLGFLPEPKSVFEEKSKRKNPIFFGLNGVRMDSDAQNFQAIQVMVNDSERQGPQRARRQSSLRRSGDKEQFNGMKPLPLSSRSTPLSARSGPMSSRSDATPRNEKVAAKFDLSFLVRPQTHDGTTRKWPFGYHLLDVPSEERREDPEFMPPEDIDEKEAGIGGGFLTARETPRTSRGTLPVSSAIAGDKWPFGWFWRSSNLNEAADEDADDDYWGKGDRSLRKKRRNWAIYPQARVNRGKVRQKFNTGGGGPLVRMCDLCANYTSREKYYSSEPRPKRPLAATVRCPECPPQVQFRCASCNADFMVKDANVVVGKEEVCRHDPGKLERKDHEIGESFQVEGNFGELYDTQSIVHPACYGYMFASGKNNPRNLNPVFFDYKVIRAPIKVDFKRKDLMFKVGKKEDADAGCPVCLLKKPGCPFCWEFPADFQPKEYAYDGKQRTKEEEEALLNSKPLLHTNLTTHEALARYRHIVLDSFDVIIKGIPMGTVLRLGVQKLDSVGFLHHLFRSNCELGTLDDCLLFMPTMDGLYCLDNAEIPETETTLGVYTGDVLLERYHMRVNKSKIILLHFQKYNLSIIIDAFQKYIEDNMYMFEQPRLVLDDHSPNIYHQIYGIPDPFPGKDYLQEQLLYVFEIQEEMDKVRIKEDVAADYKEIMEKLNEEVEARKAIALAERKERNLETYVRRRTKGGAIGKYLHEDVVGKKPKASADGNKNLQAQEADKIPTLNIPKAAAPFKRRVSTITIK